MENFKKKCKKTKKQVLNFFILIIILTFSMWIVGGNIYNSSLQLFEQINIA